MSWETATVDPNFGGLDLVGTLRAADAADLDRVVRDERLQGARAAAMAKLVRRGL